MGDIATVIRFPNCDLHPDEPVPAHYDGKTVTGPWANMCGDCFDQFGVGLGTGKGQLLMVMRCPECREPVGDHKTTGTRMPLTEAACQRTQMGAMSRD